MLNEISVGKRLKKIRKEEGISIRELASKIGCHEQSLLRWERGDHFPSLQSLELLSDFYGLTIDTLIGHSRSN